MGLQDELKRLRDHHPIEIAAYRDAASFAQAAHQQDLAAMRQKAATALMLAQGEARTLVVRLAIVKQQLRDSLACYEAQDGDNHDKKR